MWLHIYVRIEPRWGFADVRRAAFAFAREVERRAAQDVTTTFMPQDCTIATVPARFEALGDLHEGNVPS